MENKFLISKEVVAHNHYKANEIAIDECPSTFQIEILERMKEKFINNNKDGYKFILSPKEYRKFVGDENMDNNSNIGRRNE